MNLVIEKSARKVVSVATNIDKSSKILDYVLFQKFLRGFYCSRFKNTSETTIFHATIFFIIGTPSSLKQ